MLPVLPAKQRVRAGPRGSGPGAKGRRPCPPLCAAAAGWRRDKGRPDPSTRGLRPGSNKGLMGKRLDEAGAPSFAWDEPTTLRPKTKRFLSCHYDAAVQQPTPARLGFSRCGPGARLTAGQWRGGHLPPLSTWWGRVPPPPTRSAKRGSAAPQRWRNVTSWPHVGLGRGKFRLTNPSPFHHACCKGDEPPGTLRCDLAGVMTCLSGATAGAITGMIADG